MDLIVLLGNLLENALEACSRQTEGERFIFLTIRPESGAVIILVDNSFMGGRIPEGGILKVEYTEQVFSVPVMLLGG